MMLLGLALDGLGVILCVLVILLEAVLLTGMIFISITWIQVIFAILASIVALGIFSWFWYDYVQYWFKSNL